MSIEPAVEWIIEEPPARRGRTDGKHWGPIFAELKNGAGTWAIVLREPVTVDAPGVREPRRPRPTMPAAGAVRELEPAP